jgi:hypothetical protein
MPRYFFHVLDGQKYSDPSGIEFATEAAARDHALAYAKTISRLHPDPAMQVKVTDERGVEVVRVPLRDQTE